ncbi:lytic transglycosylase domain-containing protein [bacterium]|nr:lytic transglycosylase domain-containing protein [bacterium]NCQ55537.1 lytic transglycosylase domain-containing protein [Candidatus Parcubacteria bacterium]NCS67548.1 lytic transglycosylase domain-containing protein [Candidatus Peregrinibacteria bacterium]NCS96287.1 lytic transglycosylase domain-containing protein [bacterium]
MPLDGIEEPGRQSIKFLKNLEGRLEPGFNEISQSLFYLDALAGQADFEDSDVQDFDQNLFDVAFKLQQAHLLGEINLNPDRFLELFLEEVETLFNAMPKSLQAMHNETLRNLNEVIETPEIPQIEAQAEEIAVLPAKEKIQLKKILALLKESSVVTPKRLIKVLAACAALSVSSDKLNLPEAPDTFAVDINTLSAPVTEAVSQVLVPTTVPPERMVSPNTLSAPSPEDSFQASGTIAYPVEIVAAEAAGMASRLAFVLRQPERAEIFETLHGNPKLRPVVALLGVIESNLDAGAISPSGARGLFQDMGGLQGAFGDPDGIDNLAVDDLLPQITNTEYNRIINNLKNGVSMDRGTLLEFLKDQRDANTDFWQEFLTEQRTLITSIETSPDIAFHYIESLQDRALATLHLSDPAQSLNFAIMSYNLGMGHLHTLRRIMNQNGVSSFNTDTVLRFIDREDFHQILRNNNLGDLHNNYEEAQQYLARYIALDEIVRHNNSKALDSTLG